MPRPDSPSPFRARRGSRSAAAAPYARPGGRKLATPALALGGASSVGEQPARDLATASADFRPAVVEGCGRFVPEERPEALAPRPLDLVAAAR